MDTGRAAGVAGNRLTQQAKRGGTPGAAAITCHGGGPWD